MVKEVDVCGRQILSWCVPERVYALDTSKPHRHDIVDRVFEIDGKSATGEYIYREKYWDVSWCKCVDGVLPRSPPLPGPNLSRR